MNVVEVLSKKGFALNASVQEIGQIAFINKYLGRTSDIKKVSGSVLFYDERYHHEASFQIINGTWSKAKISLQSKKGAIARQVANTMSRLGTEMGCEPVYLVGFWYDMNTGEVVDYEILDQWDQCSPSTPPPYGYDSYNGGTEFVPDENCNAKAQEMTGSPVAEKQSVAHVISTALTRTKTYHWVIYKQSWGLWKFTSHEKGTHRRIPGAIKPGNGHPLLMKL